MKDSLAVPLRSTLASTGKPELEEGSVSQAAAQAGRFGDRPSRHGQMLGQVLARLAKAGRADAPGLPEMCATCAFREGTAPNQSAGTGIIALNCTLGVDPDRFACHHGMKDGEPSKLCAGFIAARMAPWSLTKEALILLGGHLQGDDPDADEVRAAFDAWAAEADPEGKLDVYQLARAYARAALAKAEAQADV